jgi:hypothetical protein
VTIPAGNGDNNIYLLTTSLTNGTAYRFAMSAVNANGESATTVSAPVTINDTSGSNTVSGSVSFTGITPTGPLYVGFFSDNPPGVFFKRIASPATPQGFSVAGVPSGTYSFFAVLDQNANGIIETGDFTNFGGPNGEPPSLVVSGNSAGNNTALNQGSVSATGSVITHHTLFSGAHTYYINVSLAMGTKQPTSMILFSGKNVAIPFDMAADRNNNFNPFYNNSVAPAVGDVYLFRVRFSDGTFEVIPATVTAVLSSFAQSLTMVTTGAGSKTVPQLTWTAPVSPPPPSPYTYAVGVFNSSGPGFWYYSGSGSGIPSSQTNVVYNFDGNASPNGPLTTGTIYNWSVEVRDSNGNSAQNQTTYTPAP